jgi:hypothetical protein
MNPSGADSVVQTEEKRATENNYLLLGEGIALFKAIPLFAFAKNRAVTERRNVATRREKDSGKGNAKC